ncbi:hypothetical protein GA707_13850 [Nostocoides sp. F2B08]|uniref:hypothetical protein n=1 Tax=Nostocoides sp. F2B08 TaxID=2653936 RepID=UPI001262CE3D|nr:hypothetical protein [Tetrasphaera sp. F2B08]KAB7743201.1 hypothetical protein GA707_13850 [Tetrasphaera sp. F2B08]
MKAKLEGFVRTAPVPLTGAVPHKGRLRVNLVMDAVITTGAGTEAVAPVARTVDLYGPGDVTGLAPGAIARTSPPDGAGDVDGEYCCFVEFTSEDLPWRYSADPNTPEKAKPWLALVAGVENRELGVARDGTLWLRPAVTSLLDPDLAAAWAHTQDGNFSRLLCPRVLPAGAQCLAALVKLHRPDGSYSWTKGAKATGIPVLHTFRFSTNEAGTFKSLVEALHPVDPPDALGQVVVHAGLPGHPERETTTYGALARYDAPGHVPLPDAGLPAAIDARLEPRPSTARGQPDDAVPPPPAPIIGAPRWSAPVCWDESAPWVAEVDTDPRHRAAAGLGARAALDWTDTILRAAATRLGDTHLAAAKLRHLTGGVAMARLTAGHLPPPGAARLAFHGPGLAAVVAGTPSGVAGALGQLFPDERPLPASLLSSAASHLLRPTGPTAKASADPGAVSNPATVLEEARRSPEPSESPLGLVEPLDGNEEGVLGELLGEREETPRLPEQDPGWVDAADQAVFDAFQPDGIPVARVVSLISGLHERWDVPLEVRPDLDLPLWDWFRRHEPDWLLPLAGELGRDGVVALRTDRAFMASALLGASRQVVAELRWRGVPVVHGWMPMRTFWQNVESAQNPAPMVDLVQTSSWPSVPLAQLPGPRGSGQELVIAMRSDLVRRYPDTQVYLAPAFGISGHGQFPILQDPIWPVWVARLDPDVWCFAFPRPPSDLPNLCLVLEEPDKGPRFRPPDGATAAGYQVRPVTYKQDGKKVTGNVAVVVDDGAELGGATWDQPIRAILPGTELVQQ